MLNDIPSPWDLLLQPDVPTLAYRPELLRLSDSAGRERIAVLLKDPRTITIDDTVEIQLRDLLKTRDPVQKLDDATANERMRAHLQGQPLSTYGVWVWYPWSRRLVHLLDESEFVELRTNRNRFKITSEEQAKLASNRVGIVGLSVGHAIALNIALERTAGELRLADFDHLELSNLNRIRSTVFGLNLPKVVNTAREIAELDPFLQVTCFGEGLHAGNYEDFLSNGGTLNLVIDECDSFDVKCELRIEARQRRIAVIMATSDRGLLDIERFDHEPHRPIFHGLAGDLNPAFLKGLTTEEKIPYVLQILGQESISKRLRASMIEIDQQIKTWPQLGSAVAHGAGCAAEVVRRLGLGEAIASGRYFDDLDLLLNHVADPATSDPQPAQRPGIPFNIRHAAKINPPNHQRVTFQQHGNQQVPGSRDTFHCKIRHIVSDAILAPSAANSQPWKWSLSGSTLTLRLDRNRTSDALDYLNTGSLVALGAAAENLQISAHVIGLPMVTQPFPEGSASDIVARFQFDVGSPQQADSAWRSDLAPSISLRHTNRSFRERTILPDATLDALTAAVTSVDGARVQWITAEHQLDELAKLLGITDRLRNLNPIFHAELVRELRWTPEEALATRDGIDIRSLDLSPSDLAGLRISCDPATLALVREWNGGRNFEKMTARAVRSASAMGLITMPSHGLADFFNGGRSVQRCWLTATAQQLAMWPMTALPYFFARLFRGNGSLFESDEQVELRELRKRYKRLFDLTNEDGEVLLFRIGFGETTSIRSLRREVDDVFECVE